MFGDTLTGVGMANTVMLHIHVTGGNGQTLRVTRNGTELTTVPVASDDFSLDQPAVRTTDEGPLGTYYRIETQDSMTRTTIGNPIFLKG